MKNSSLRVRAPKNKKIITILQPVPEGFDIYRWIKSNFLFKGKQYYHLTPYELEIEKEEFMLALGEKIYKLACEEASLYGAWIGYEC